MKTAILIGALLCAPVLVFSQQKTHDHEKFVKKVKLSMSPTLIGKWMPDEAAIAYAASKTGDSKEELKREVEEATELIKEDAQFLIDNRVALVYKSVDVNVVKSSPIKIADIVLNCDFKGDRYTVTLKNCVQTDQSWYLGNQIVAEGDGLKDLMAKNEERRKKAENGFLANLEKQVEEQETSNEENTGPQIYKASRFPMQGADATSQFVRHDQVGQILNGYYIDKNYNQINVRIKYDAPEIMSDPNKKLMIGENGLKGISKGQLEAFYVGGQIYVFSGEFWDILIEEGAIRRLARIVKSESTNNYVLGELTQKLLLEPENNASLALGFKSKMAELVSDNTELARKIEAKEEGYKFKDLTKIRIEYNRWYDEQYPNQVVYLFEKLAGDNVEETGEETEEISEEVVNNYASMSDLELKSEFTEAIKQGLVGVVLDMIQKDDRVSANSGTNGTMSPMLTAIEFNQFKLARVLISEGADVKAKDHLGRTGLHLVMKPVTSEGDTMYDKLLIESLIKNGLDINAQDNKGRTALHTMAQDPNCEMIQEFVDNNNPDKSIKNKNGETAQDIVKDYTNDPTCATILAP